MKYTSSADLHQLYRTSASMIRVLSVCADFGDALVDAEAEVNQMQRRGHAVHPCDEVVPGLRFGDCTQVARSHWCELWKTKKEEFCAKCERSCPSHQRAE